MDIYIFHTSARLQHKANIIHALSLLHFGRDYLHVLSVLFELSKLHDN